MRFETQFALECGTIPVQKLFYFLKYSFSGSTHDANHRYRRWRVGIKQSVLALQTSCRKDTDML